MHSRSLSLLALFLLAACGGNDDASNPAGGSAGAPASGGPPETGGSASGGASGNASGGEANSGGSVDPGEPYTPVYGRFGTAESTFTLPFPEDGALYHPDLVDDF